MQISSHLSRVDKKGLECYFATIYFLIQIAMQDLKLIQKN